MTESKIQISCLDEKGIGEKLHRAAINGEFCPKHYIVMGPLIEKQTITNKRIVNKTQPNWTGKTSWQQLDKNSTTNHIHDQVNKADKIYSVVELTFLAEV